MKVKGTEILNVHPVNKLPKTSIGLSWRDRGVEGWGTVHFQAVNGEDGCLVVENTETVEYYIESFKEYYGEEPIFKINGEEPWFGKIVILNESFKKRKEEFLKAKSAYLGV